MNREAIRDNSIYRNTGLGSLGQGHKVTKTSTSLFQNLND